MEVTYHEGGGPRENVGKESTWEVDEGAPEGGLRQKNKQRREVCLKKCDPRWDMEEGRPPREAVEE